MKKTFWFSGFILLLLYVVPFVYAAEPRLVRVGAFNYYPGIFKDSDGQIKGFYVDALADLARRENLRIEYVYGSRNEGLERIKSGEIDLLTSVAYTPERATYMDYTETRLLTDWGELFMRPESHIHDIREAGGKKVAVMKGDIIGQNFIELSKKIGISCEFIELPDFEGVFQAVAARQVDAGVVNSTFGMAKRKKYGLRSTGVVFSPFDLYYTVAKGRNQDLLAVLDTYLHDWSHQKDSVYAQARRKWGHNPDNAVRVVPEWLKNTATVLGVLTLAALAFIILLRRQVQQKTAEILQREAGLQQSNAMITLLLNSTAEAIYGIDLSGNCSFCNTACLTILGYATPEQLLGKNMHALVHHTHADGSPFDENDCSIFKSFQTGQPIHIDHEVLWRADGSSFQVEYWSHPIFKDGNVVGSVVTFFDISERRQMETKLRESEERYRSIFVNSHSIMLIIDPDSGAILDANSAATAFYGWTREQLQTMRIHDINTLSPEQVAEKLHMAQQNNRHHFHFKHRLANNSIRDVEAFSSPIRIGTDTLLFAIIHDITERKRLESTLFFLLQCSTLPSGEDFFEALARYLAQTLEVEYVCIDRLEADNLEAQTVAVYNDGRFESNVRYALQDTPCGEVVGKNICLFEQGVRHQFPNDAVLQDLKAESYIGTTLWGLDGKPIGLIALIGRRPLTSSGHAESVLQMVAIRAAAELERRLAEQQHKQLELQLHHAQRMEAIGTLAGGIAHDFNNILTAIIGYAHISQMSLPPDAPQRATIQQITEAANRATHLTRDLLLFSRKQTASRKMIDLNDCLANTKAFLQRIISEEILLETRLCPEPLILNADPQQLDQVLMNLTTNARDAMPDGGTITLATELVQLSRDEAVELGLGSAGEYALIRFADTGNGIEPEHLTRIFDPFFTTKEIGKGTGLGLPIVYGIVTSHEGVIKISSSPGHGTLLTIYLPCSRDTIPAAKAQEEDVPLPRGTETILMAEDSERIREMISQVLAEFGYNVITAVDGEDAVRLFRQNSDQIRLLLFDLVMPHLGGHEAYQQIRQIRPDIPVLFTTGYAPQVAEGKLTREQIDQLLHKPYAIVKLLRSVRATLDAQEILM